MACGVTPLVSLQRGVREGLLGGAKDLSDVTFVVRRAEHGVQGGQRREVDAVLEECVREAVEARDRSADGIRSDPPQAQQRRPRATSHTPSVTASHLGRSDPSERGIRYHLAA
jgi:hypothetical protein